MISIFCDLTYNEARAIKVDDFNYIIETITRVLNKKSIFRQRFTIDNVKYGFIPNLDNMSFGEYIDLDTFIKNEEDLHKVMTVLYRQIEVESFGKYRIEDYTGEEDFDIMLDAPMDIVNAAIVFFWDLGNDLLRLIPNYLQKQLNKTIASKQISEQDGDGIRASMQSLTDNLENLMKQQEHLSIKL